MTTESTKKDALDTASTLKRASASLSDIGDGSVTEIEIQGDYGSGRDHVFSDPKVADYWRNVYETAHYEGRHRFDPTFTWSAAEELRLKRKVCGP